MLRLLPFLIVSVVHGLGGNKIPLLRVPSVSESRKGSHAGHQRPVNEFGNIPVTKHDEDDVLRALFEAELESYMSLSFSMETSLSMGNSMMPNIAFDFSMSMQMPVQVIEPLALDPFVGDFSSDCETAYAYCPGISECFAPEDGSSHDWGWSIDLQNVDLTNGNVVVCEVYTGADQCNRNAGVNIGTFSISQSSVEWVFSEGFGATELQLYGGQCAGNDGGKHLQTGVCESETFERLASSPGEYSLVADGFNPALPDFTFDETDNTDLRKGIWEIEDYQLFPLTANRSFLSAHATVCPCNSIEINGCEDKTPSSPLVLNGPTLPPVDVASTTGDSEIFRTSLSTNSETDVLTIYFVVFVVAGFSLIAATIVYYKRGREDYIAEPSSVSSFSF